MKQRCRSIVKMAVLVEDVCCSKWNVSEKVK